MGEGWGGGLQRHPLEIDGVGATREAAGRAQTAQKEAAARIAKLQAVWG